MSRKTYGLKDDWMDNINIGALGVAGIGEGGGAANHSDINMYPGTNRQPEQAVLRVPPGMTWEEFQEQLKPKPLPLATPWSGKMVNAQLKQPPSSVHTVPAGMINVGEWFKKEGFNPEWMHNSVRVNGIPISTADMQLVDSTYYAPMSVLEQISHMIPAPEPYSGSGTPTPPPEEGGVYVPPPEEGGNTGGKEGGTGDGQGGTGGGQGVQTPEEVTIEKTISTIMDIVNKDRGELPILSWDQALSQSQSQLDPLYADKAKDLQYATDVDLSRRGIFRSGLGSKISADKLGDLQNEQVSAIAALAQTLIEASRNASFTDRGLDIDAMGAEGGIIGNLMNSLISQQGNQMSYELGKEQNAISRAQQQSDANYQNWAMTNEGKASEYEKYQMAMQAWEQSGVAPNNSALQGMGIAAGTPYGEGGGAGDMTWAQDFGAAMEVWESTGTAPSSKALKFYGINPGDPWSQSAKDKVESIELAILTQEYEPVIRGQAVTDLFNEFLLTDIGVAQESGVTAGMNVDYTEAAMSYLASYGTAEAAASRLEQQWGEISALDSNNFQAPKENGNLKPLGKKQLEAVKNEITRLAPKIDAIGYKRAYIAASLTDSELPTLEEFIIE